MWEKNRPCLGKDFFGLYFKLKKRQAQNLSQDFVSVFTLNPKGKLAAVLLGTLLSFWIYPELPEISLNISLSLQFN